MPDTVSSIRDTVFLIGGVDGIVLTPRIHLYSNGCEKQIEANFHDKPCYPRSRPAIDNTLAFFDRGTL